MALSESPSREWVRNKGEVALATFDDRIVILSEKCNLSRVIFCADVAGSALSGQEISVVELVFSAWEGPTLDRA